jgi:hypothetical protein
MSQKLRLYTIPKAETGASPFSGTIIDLSNPADAERLRQEILAARNEEMRAIPASEDAAKAFWALIKGCGLHRVAPGEPEPRLHHHSDKVYGRKTATVFLSQAAPDLRVNFYRIAFFRPLVEVEWLDCPDPEALACMLLHQREYQQHESPRQRRLFACACCRRIWDRLSPAGRNAVVVSERFADGEATQEELAAAQQGVVPAVEQHLAAFPLPVREGTTEQSPALDEYLESFLLPSVRFQLEPYNGQEDRCAGFSIPELRARLAEVMPHRAALHVSGPAWSRTGPHVGRAPVDAARAAVGSPGEDFATWCSAMAEEQRAQADLFRDILGNPFHKSVRPAPLPTNVLRLAEALYEGEACHLVLHDSLVEAGHSVLAEHFQEESHPKGCWALDLLLNKETEEA